MGTGRAGARAFGGFGRFIIVLIDFRSGNNPPTETHAMGRFGIHGVRYSVGRRYCMGQLDWSIYSVHVSA